MVTMATPEMVVERATPGARPAAPEVASMVANVAVVFCFEF